MTAAGASPVPAAQRARRDVLPVIRAEWIKLRSVRGWLISLLGAVALCIAFTFLVADGTHEGSCTAHGICTSGHPFVPTGPGGAAVADTYRFLERPLTGDGTITLRVASLTGLTWTGPSDEAPTLAHTRPGLAPWAKAGILLTPSTRQGSPYAAVMATGAHGVRFQYDYTHDRPGLPGAITRSAPRWLRLTRTGDTITGFDSTDGRSWTRIGATRLARLPATVDVGPFVTSPVSFRDSGGGAATRATARFDRVAVDGRVGGGGWRGASVGGGPNDYYTVLGRGGDHRSGTTFVVDGSGDIALATNPLAGGDTESDSLWFGLLVALLVIVVIATMFITSEYRRGLIRTTFSAVPARGSVLAAKAVVVGAVAFVAGAVAAAVGIPLGMHVLEVNGDYVFPAGVLTEVQVVAGSGALLGLVAVTVVALGAILRSAAGAVSTAIALFVLPYAVGMVASGGAGAWLLRLTPAAGFSVLGVLARSSLVDSAYTLANGYYPLAPWAGLAVLCAYAAAALWLAGFLLHRRDA